MDELGEEVFWYDAFHYIRAHVVITTYRNMPEESRRKLRSRMTIGICKEYAPRRNYDIPKSEVGEFVEGVLADWEAKSIDERNLET